MSSGKSRFTALLAITAAAAIVTACSNDAADQADAGATSNTMPAAESAAGTAAQTTASVANSHPTEATPEYGRRLLRETPALIGPNNPDPEMQYSGNQLACSSCHLNDGKTPGTLSLLPTSGRYPRQSNRDGGIRDLRDRINGCMERSMNGRMLPRDSIEMIAMEAYIDDLGVQYAAMTEAERAPVEPPAFIEPDRAANVEAGRAVYEQHCFVCHGNDGGGLRVAESAGGAYVFPPLWGPDSYNNGAGMTRTLTAAKFIKARMPFGQPILTDDQAYDVSAYINSHERPTKANRELDFPDKTLKPIDCPYPPYADDFPQEQHILGPFNPIREYYQNLKK